MSDYIATKYKGVFRCLPEINTETNDFPRDADGNIDQSTGVYISCQNGNKIYAYGRNGHKEMQLCAYIPSLGRGRNIKKYMDKDNIRYDNYDETDEEVSFVFSSNDIDKVASLLKVKTSGKDISPFSTKNLPRTKIELSHEKIDAYKKITSRLAKEDMLAIKRINSSFMNDILAKKLRENGKRKPFDWSSDMKKMKMTGMTKQYIDVKGLWEDYIEYLNDKINEYIQTKE